MGGWSLLPELYEITIRDVTDKKNWKEIKSSGLRIEKVDLLTGTVGDLSSKTRTTVLDILLVEHLIPTATQKEQDTEKYARFQEALRDGLDKNGITEWWNYRLRITKNIRDAIYKEEDSQISPDGTFKTTIIKWTLQIPWPIGD